jgi:hypothetical protein
MCVKVNVDGQNRFWKALLVTAFYMMSLCPHNMEHLEFVHFVDEDLCPTGLPKDAFKDIENSFGDFPFKDWEGVIANTIGLRWNYDNHARGLRFGELSVLPTPGRYENLLLDRHIATSYDMDVVENTANALWSRKFDKTQLQLILSDKLLRSSIISLQTVDGPWHPAIADLRSDGLLKQYRRKLQTSSVDNVHDIDQRVGELSAEFEKITTKIVEEHLDTTGLFKSIAMFVVGLIPYVGNIISGGEMLKNVHDKIIARRDCGWVGFLGKAQQKLKQPATGTSHRTEK